MLSDVESGSGRSRGAYKRRAAVVGAEMGADWRSVAGVPSIASVTLRPSLLEFVEVRNWFMDDPGRDRMEPFLSKLDSLVRSLLLSLPGSQLRLTSLLRRPSRSRALGGEISGVILRVTSSSRLRVR